LVRKTHYVVFSIGVGSSRCGLVESCYIKEAAKRELSIELPPEKISNEDSEVEKLLADARNWREQQRRREFGAHGRQSGIAQALFAVVVFATYLRQQRSSSIGNRHPILWLRRFDSARENKAFKSLLAEACCGMATVVTVSDSSVSYSFDRGFERFSWLTNTLLVVVVVANFFPFEKAVFAFDAVFVVFALIALCVFVFRGLGFTKISREDPAEQVVDVIQGIRNESNTGYSEPLVLKCDQQSWQTTVATAEALCDAVVLDVADFSSNMQWELGTALRLNPSETVILVCGLEDGADEKIPSRTLAQMQKVMGAGLVDTCPVFFFPLNEDLLTVGTKQPYSDRLQRLLAEAIVRKSHGKLMMNTGMNLAEPSRIR
jgi:hypothetical protein